MEENLCFLAPGSLCNDVIRVSTDGAIKPLATVSAWRFGRVGCRLRSLGEGHSRGSRRLPRGDPRPAPNPGRPPRGAAVSPGLSAPWLWKCGPIKQLLQEE